MKRKLLALILALCLLLGIVPVKADALTYQKENYCDPGFIWSFLVQTFNNEYSAAAIMANFYRESKFVPIASYGRYGIAAWSADTDAFDNSGNPAAFSGYAYGMAQWLGPRKVELYNFAKSMDASVGNGYVQLMFMVHELTRNPYFLALNTFNDLKAAGSIQYAFNVFVAEYEGASYLVNSDISMAVYFYNQFHGSTAQPAAEEAKDKPAEETTDKATEETTDKATEETTDKATEEKPATTAKANTESAQKKTETTAPAPAPVVVKSSDNLLGSVTSAAGKLEPAFSPWTSDYKLTVDYYTDNLGLSYAQSDARSVVNIVAPESLKVGDNTVDIYVTAEDGSQRLYRIIVTRLNNKRIVADVAKIPETFDAEGGFANQLSFAGVKPEQLTLPRTFDVEPAPLVELASDIPTEEIIEADAAQTDESAAPVNPMLAFINQNPLAETGVILGIAAIVIVAGLIISKRQDAKLSENSNEE